MPFPVALSSGEKTTLRTPGYWQRTLVVLNPSETVFRAQSAVDLTDAPFITFAYDNVDVGAFGDVLEGMVCYISATTDIRDAKYRGRVRLVPTSTDFYIDENATLLNTGDYIIVVRDADLFARVRRDTLVDGSIPYHNLPPMMAALPSVLCLYDADADGNVSYTTVQTGVPVASGAAITGWLHTISGDGTVTFTSGTTTSQNPTVQFEAGFHYLWQVQVTDDNGVSNYQMIQVYTVTRTFDAPANTAVVTGDVSHDIDSGFTAALIGYADLTTLIDRTHCAVFTVEHFGDDSDTPIVTNVLMNGRIRSDSINTVGTDDAGQVQQVSFAVEGITSYLQRLKIPSDIVRNVAVPDEWGEMVDPNPFRMAVYAMWAYTTLTNICSFSAESGDFDAWRIGAEPVAIDGEFAIDLLRNLLWERIKAQPNFAPTGEIFLARNTNFLADRSGVVTVIDFTLEDMREFTLDRDSSRVTAQVIAYGGVFESAINQFTLYTSQAPSIVYGDAPETKELTRELLEHDSSVADATTELATRSSNFYAFENPRPLNNVTFYDSMAWLIATNYLRYTFTVPASSNMLGIPYTLEDFWWLQRVNLTINPDGSVDVSAEFPAETSFNDAQVMASLLPNNLSNLNPVLPVLPNDPAFPTDPLELYPSDDPGLGDLQPIDNYSLANTQMPVPPNIAADTAEKQGSTKCQALAVNFRNPNNVSSPKLTVLGGDYTLSIVGSAAIDAEVVYSDPMTSGLGSKSHELSATYPFGTWTAAGNPTRDGTDGGSWIPTQGRTGGGSIEGMIVPAIITQAGVTIDLGVESTVTAFSCWSKFELSNPGATANWLSFWDAAKVMITEVDIGAGGSFGVYGQATWSGSVAGARYVVMNITGNQPAPSRAYLDDISVTYAGSGGAAFGDGFYVFNIEEGVAVDAQLYGASEGLRLDNAVVNPVLIPPFAANHSYKIPFTGTGNQLAARMEFLSYLGNANINLQLQLCRVQS